MFLLEVFRLIQCSWFVRGFVSGREICCTTSLYYALGHTLDLELDCIGSRVSKIYTKQFKKGELCVIPHFKASQVNSTRSDIERKQ